MQDMELLRL